MSSDPIAQPAWRRYLRFFRRDIAADVDDELAFHIEKRIQELVARGVDAAAAKRQVLARFGNVADIRRECVDVDRERQGEERRRAVLLDLGEDVRYALRILRREKLAATLIVLCLALGIGSTVTVFSVGDALLLRPLPFPNGARLVSVGSTRPGFGMGVSSFEDFTDWRTRQRSFSALGAIQRRAYTSAGDEPRRISGASVTSGVFDALGVPAMRGRLFSPDDDTPGAPAVAVVTAAFATRMLGGVDSAVGRSLMLDQRDYAVVGVIAERSAYPDRLQLWTSMPRATDPGLRSSRSLDLVGALRDDVTIDAARRDLNALSAAMTAEHPDADRDLGAEIAPLRERYIGASRPAFIAICCAAGLLLLIACANVASMQLARAAPRVREVAVRTALGAAPRRVVRLLLTESVMLAVAGGALGIAFAMTANRLVAAAIPASLAPWMAPTIDARVLGFTLLVSMLSGVAFGLAPARRLSRIAPVAMLHQGRGGVDPRRMAAQRTLVVAEIALSVVMVVGATLAGASFQRLTSLDPGFDARGVATFRIGLHGARYENAESQALLAQLLVERLRSLPGVAAAAAASHAPIADCCSRFGLRVEGEDDRTAEHLVTGNVVTPDYFRTLRIGLVRGRYLANADRAGAPPVIVINESFERELFHGQDAIGKIVHRGSTDVTVVGVVRDVKQTRLSDAPEPQFYHANAQEPWDDLTILMRVAGGDPAAVIAPARAVLKGLDAQMPATRAVPLTTLIESAVATQKTFSVLLLTFAGIALLLATAGVYGVTAYYVAQRTSELGIRMALGAQSHRLLALVAAQALGLAAIGMVVGLLGAALAARGLTRMLYGVSAGEPAIYLAAAAAMAVASVGACIGPARRAVCVDPMIALRAE